MIVKQTGNKSNTNVKCTNRDFAKPFPETVDFTTFDVSVHVFAGMCVTNNLFSGVQRILQKSYELGDDRHFEIGSYENESVGIGRSEKHVTEVNDE